MFLCKKFTKIIAYLFLVSLGFKIIRCDFYRSTCKSIPNLTKQQLEVCYKAPDVTLVAMEGLEMSINECQFQFRNNRWNCSSLKSKKIYPYTSNMWKKGYRESAFGHAIASAGVVLSVARACSQGRLLSCGCDPNTHQKGISKSLRDSLERERKKFLEDVNKSPFIVDKDLERRFGLNSNEISPKGRVKHKMSYQNAKNRWLWSGCSHNIDFGIEFSKLFLDVREKSGDILAKVNLHNNNVGRLVVTNNLVGKCKCHGLSGSCQLKTCWKSSPDFRTIGKILKQNFRNALQVDQSNLGNKMVIYRRNKRRNIKAHKYHQIYIRENAQSSARKKRKKKNIENSLLFFQKSPNFCEKDLKSDIPGTHGRRCNRTSVGSDSCVSLCCGRGYYLVKQVTNLKDNCRFHWCCYVECQEREHIEWISVCN